MKLSNITIISGLVLIAITKINAKKSNYCIGMNGNEIPFTVISATSPNSIGLNTSFELYRTLLGGVNNGNSIEILPTGHRQINWDAPIVPFNMPPDFFVRNITRGQNSRSSNNMFVVSNPVNNTVNGPDNLFDSINKDVAANLQAFTQKRLFALLGSTTIYIEFSVPGAPFTSRATVQGFGSVFVDVNEENLTNMIFYAKSGCVIAEEYVPSFAGGLSFVGGYSNDPNFPIYTVEMELGSKALDDDKSKSCFATFFRSEKKNKDVVVMDDFIYSEPKAV